MPPSRNPNFRAKDRQKSRRPPGCQEGHKGGTLQPVDKHDQVIPIEMKPEDVPPGYRKVGYEARQVFDIILKRHIIRTGKPPAFARVSSILCKFCLEIGG